MALRNTFVIGDIHGGYLALKQLIERINLQTTDRLIFLGDYVDGWPDSVLVIEFLHALKDIYECIFILGNHDVELRKYLNGEPTKPDWISHGGVGTVKEYELAKKKIKKKHLTFLQEDLKSYFIDEDNNLFVHGGFTVVKGVMYEKYPENFYLDRTLWETARCMDKSLHNTDLIYPKRMLNYNEIFIGHTPTVNYGIFEPMHGGNVWNLDSGAGFNGPLSAMNIRTKEIIKSDIVQTLYPGYSGRNIK